MRKNSVEVNSYLQKILKYNLKKIHEKYLTDDKIFSLMMSRSNKNSKILDEIDILNKIVMSAIQFEEYHRAIRYMALLNKICKANFK